ncbi:MAG: allantoinase PuuE [Pseudomonadota bacterium]
MTSYPRDHVGYGANPPDPQWPGGARLALSIVLNYEEGAERNILDGDGEAESYLQEIVGAPALVGARNYNVESMYNYGSRAGFWRLHRALTARSVPITVYGATLAMMRNPDAVRAMVDAGWEIATHAYRWFDYSTLSEPEERQHLADTIREHTALTGSRPVGWYCGRMSDNTRRLVAEDGGFLYDSDDYSDDLPYWNLAHEKPLLIIPYTLDANDFRFVLPQGFNTADHFADYLIDTFDTLYTEGGRMMNVGLHCRLAGKPGRLPGLTRFLDHVATHNDVWICRREDIARHWMATHPA